MRKLCASGKVEDCSRRFDRCTQRHFFSKSMTLSILHIRDITRTHTQPSVQPTVFMPRISKNFPVLSLEETVQSRFSRFIRPPSLPSTFVAAQRHPRRNKTQTRAKAAYASTSKLAPSLFSSTSRRRAYRGYTAARINNPRKYDLRLYRARRV